MAQFPSPLLRAPRRRCGEDVLPADYIGITTSPGRRRRRQAGGARAATIWQVFARRLIKISSADSRQNDNLFTHYLIISCDR